ncbi:MAG: flavin reductase family protein [Lachnospiraceae bacterium]|nr:flavin reductase family protein [Lachnospiraceae bacterium]
MTEGTAAKQYWKGGNMLYPLPAVLVSCGRFAGENNILTLAWAGTVCSDPPMVSVSIRPERYSYGIIRESGEFVINLTTCSLARAADLCGVRSGRDINKWEACSLHPGEGKAVEAPLILESPVNLECRVSQVLELGSHHMFLAMVEGVWVDERLLDQKGRLHLEKADLMAYSHGEYISLGKKLGQFGFSVRRREKTGTVRAGRASEKGGRKGRS